MHGLLTILQIPIGIILITLILLQAKGVGLGRSLTGSAYHSKRGVEFVVFRLTIAISIIFVILSVATLIVAK